MLCGDFNAEPDSDEIRMLTGLAAVAVPKQVFVDAWRACGDGAGHDLRAHGNRSPRSISSPTVASTTCSLVSRARAAPATSWRSTARRHGTGGRDPSVRPLRVCAELRY